jgi:hypothetical protein
MELELPLALEVRLTAAGWLELLPHPERPRIKRREIVPERKTATVLRRTEPPTHRSSGFLPVHS